MLDPRIIANEVLRRAEASGRPLTNLHMQKVIYFLHGEWLTATGQPLVSGHFEAWQFGPVHRVLYDAFREFGDAPIAARARRYDPIRRSYSELPAVDDDRLTHFLDSTLPRYLDLPAFVLVQKTHAPGTPWSRTMEGAERRANVGMVIENGTIAKHFEGIEPAPTGTRARKRAVV